MPAPPPPALACHPHACRSDQIDYHIPNLSVGRLAGVTWVAEQGGAVHGWMSDVAHMQRVQVLECFQFAFNCTNGLEDAARLMAEFKQVEDRFERDMALAEMEEAGSKVGPSLVASTLRDASCVGKPLAEARALACRRCQGTATRTTLQATLSLPAR